MAIEVVNKQRLVAIDRRRVALLANAALAEVGRAGAGASIVFVRDQAMRRLNREYRGRDGPTDVLSFPAEDEGESVGANVIDPILIEPDMIDYIGDVVISAETALRQAEDAGHSFEREVSELVIHGVLHLCGYDHETDRGEMNRLELKLRRKLLDRAAGATRGR